MAFDYRINNISIRRCSNITDLGVTFDCELTFSLHIEKVISAALKMLGFIFRTCSQFTSTCCLRSLYYTLVRSRLEYCSIVWSPYYVKYVDAVEGTQRKFAKYMWFKNFHEYPARGTSNAILYDSANLKSLSVRRINSLLIFLYKILHGLIDSSFLLSLVSVNVPQMNLRAFRFFYIPKPNTNVLRHSPIFLMCELYNAIADKCDVFNDTLMLFRRAVDANMEILAGVMGTCN